MSVEFGRVSLFAFMNDYRKAGVRPKTQNSKYFLKIGLKFYLIKKFQENEGLDILTAFAKNFWNIFLHPWTKIVSKETYSMTLARLTF